MSAAAAATSDSSESSSSSSSERSQLEDTLRSVRELRKAVPHIIFQRTSAPAILCSKLPDHWRSNKSLPTPFVVVFLRPVPDGTKVKVFAGNDENPNAMIRNAESVTRNGVASFSDLRFVGRSGRGHLFHVMISVASKPQQIGIVYGAVKITADGKRDPRPYLRTTSSESQGQDDVTMQSTSSASSMTEAMPHRPRPTKPLKSFNAMPIAFSHNQTQSRGPPSIVRIQPSEGSAFQQVADQQRRHSVDDRSVAQPPHNATLEQ